ncbi:MAG: DNA repair protein RecN, partial [Betaproteobacteria bacterium]|nr:DNA repair protein RecN [Betaproteobacteria bacterium]
HLAQVASQAHHQLKVIKREDKGLAYSEVLSLDSADRIEEIARMLGGRDITDTTRRAAHEMLQR